VAATVTFIVAYAHSAQHARWPIALSVGLAAWLCAAWVVVQLPESVGVSLALAAAALFAAPRISPRPAPERGGRAVGRGELAARMLAGALLTVAVTLAAGVVGPRWSGSLAIFPVLASVLAVFSHRAQGSAFVAALLRSMTLGMGSLAAFCLVLAATLPMLGLTAAFVLATAGTALVQAATRGRSAA
jgi:hypothetical protein